MPNPQYNAPPLYSLLYKGILKPAAIEYKNPSPENETPHSIGPLPDELRMKIFCFLDIHPLVQLIISCKKLKNLANEDSIRGRLDSAQKKSKIVRSLESKQLNPKDKVGEIASSFNKPLSLPFLLSSNEREVSNDHPEKGFIMKPAFY